MATNKRTGKIDIKRLNEIKKVLEDFASGGKDKKGTDETEKTRIPRFLSERKTKDEDFCTGDGRLLENFIRPTVVTFIETVANDY